MHLNLKISDFLEQSIKEKMFSIDQKIEKTNKMFNFKIISTLSFFITVSLFAGLIFFTGLKEFTDLKEISNTATHDWFQLFFIFTFIFFLIFMLISTICFSNGKNYYILNYKGVNSEFNNFNNNFLPLSKLNSNFKVLVQDKNSLPSDVLQIIENAESRGSFYNYEIVLLQQIKNIEDKIKKETQLSI